MHPALAPHDSETNVHAIWFVEPGTYDAVKAELPDVAGPWLDASGFKPEAGALTLFPAVNGGLGGAVFGLGAKSSPLRTPLLPGKLATSLPPLVYAFSNPPDNMELATLAFMLSAYRFDTYKTSGEQAFQYPRLVPQAGLHVETLALIADGARLAADLINRPANDMGPAELEKAARHLAETHSAGLSVTKGDELISGGFPMIHAVGRAAGLSGERAPRLIDLIWGDSRDPKVTLIGKGVCFDTGGLDLKSADGMLLMKKDMGGAANVLGLASMIMEANLAIRLRVLIPAVENSIAGNAFRPGDILSSRKGLTVEIGNTDAEGRLVLADALALADEEEPDLLIDMATLTGAARVALGPDLPPFFTNDDALATALEEASQRVFDPLWRLPLWPGYEAMLESKFAAISNVGRGRFAGAITAALFLNRFVEKAKSYVHFDIYGWRPTAMPGAPEGGAAQGIRALFTLLRERYAP